ncbi:MAG: ribosome maturation factor RimM [Terracidiphilus sp.]|nr:ribosome maturation factor RimM [Terracidiphilus sp.]
MTLPSGSGAPPISSPAPEPKEIDSWTWLARLRRPQGRKGEILAEILTDFPEKFAERRHLWLLPPGPFPKSPSSAPLPKAEPRTQPVPRPVELIHHWLHKGSVVLHFAGIDSISAAEELSGLIVAIPSSERASLDTDEVYIADLIGSELIDLAGPAPVSLGPILDVDRTAGPVALLVVQGANGEILIPFAKSFLRSIDIEHKRIEMSLPPGLASINE